MVVGCADDVVGAGVCVRLAAGGGPGEGAVGRLSGCEAALVFKPVVGPQRLTRLAALVGPPAFHAWVWSMSL